MEPLKAAKAGIGAFVGTLEYEDGLLVAWGYVVEHGMLKLFLYNMCVSLLR